MIPWLNTNVWTVKSLWWLCPWTSPPDPGASTVLWCRCHWGRWVGEVSYDSVRRSWCGELCHLEFWILKGHGSVCSKHLFQLFCAFLWPFYDILKATTATKVHKHKSDGLRKRALKKYYIYILCGPSRMLVAHHAMPKTWKVSHLHQQYLVQHGFTMIHLLGFEEWLWANLWAWSIPTAWRLAVRMERFELQQICFSSRVSVDGSWVSPFENAKNIVHGDEKHMIIMISEQQLQQNSFELSLLINV